MVLMYIMYIVLMYFNPKLGGYVIGKVKAWKSQRKSYSEKTPLLPNYADPQKLHGKCNICRVPVIH